MAEITVKNAAPLKKDLLTGTATINGTVNMSGVTCSAEGQDVFLWKNRDGSFEYIRAKGGDSDKGYGYESSVTLHNGTVQKVIDTHIISGGGGVALTFSGSTLNSVQLSVSSGGASYGSNSNGGQTATITGLRRTSLHFSLLTGSATEISKN